MAGMSGTWFRCDSSKLLGAIAGMESDCGYLYTVILLRIYEVGGPISDDERTLARRTGLSPKKVAAALAWLIKYGKIDSLERGLLDSVTTHEEIAYREKLIKDAKKAGNTSVKKRAGVLFKKHKQNQQNGATPVERPLNAGLTPVERPSTDIELELDVDSERPYLLESPTSSTIVSIQGREDSDIESLRTRGAA
jgi:uncharacterized protein YdaU (DUF1376 family)